MRDERLRLTARDAADLAVIAAILQDAIVPIADMRYLADERRFVLIANRFCWEQASEAGEPADGKPREAAFADRPEGDCRTLSAFVIEKAQNVRSRGIDPTKRDQFLSVLTVRADGAQAIEIVFAGGGLLRLDVEEMAVFLSDVSETWPTPIRPHHEIADR